jgi:glycerophosphoryl diester phosphodiesterase
LARNWRPLVAADLCYKAITVILLTPLIASGLRTFLSLSGQEVLADADIAYFLFRPAGLLTMFLAGTIHAAIIAWEQVSLLAILALDAKREPRSAFRGLLTSGRLAAATVRLVGHAIVRVSLYIGPLIAIGALAYWLLLTDHDINYYLQSRPPQFVVAIAIGAALVVALAILALRLAASWAIALPILLLESEIPRRALLASAARVIGKRWTIIRRLIAWLLIVTAASAIMSGAVHLAAVWLLPRVSGSISVLCVALAIVVSVWIIIQLVASLFLAAGLAAVQFQIYRELNGDRWEPAWVQQTAVPPRRQRSLARRFACLVAIALAFALAVGYFTMTGIRLNNTVEITAHRGASGAAPENTLAAVREAIQQGADWVEIDVQETADGEVVVFHDSDFMRQAADPMKIWDATSDRLAHLDIGSWYAPEFSRERVPNLRDVLQECKDKIHVNIELKYYGHDVDLERKVVEIVESLNMQNQIVVMSLETRGVQRLKSLRPDWTCGFLTAVKIGELWKAPGDFLAVKASLATRKFVRSAHRHGKRVYVWTVNDPVSISNMISRGVDNIITDYPAVAQSVLQQRASLSAPERLLLEIAELFGIRTQIIDQ